jgi:hypothetical protein
MIKGKLIYQSEKIKVTPEMLVRIENYLKSHNLGNRGVEDGDKRKQLVGLLGEIIVTERLTGRPVNLDERNDGFDGGFDLIHNGRRIDVKTMERKSFVRGDYVNNFYIMQESYAADVIVFCSFNSKEGILEICGWIPKKELATRGIFYKAGTLRKRADNTSFTFRQDNYEVENKNLDPIKTL